MEKTCLKAGITGGIGSGKTTVCRLFQTLGIPVYDADYWAKWLIQNDESVRKGILEVFGENAYLPNGDYHIAEVKRQILNNRALLEQLNAIVHPAVFRNGREWHLARAAEGHPYTLKEAALMIESGSYRDLDTLIFVAAPEALRIQRVMERDGRSETEIKAIIRNQLPESEKEKLAEWVIHNDGRHSLVRQVWAIHQALLVRSGHQPA